MSDKASYIVKCGLIGLLGGLAYLAVSGLWEGDFSRGDEPTREVLSDEQIEALKADALKVSAIRKLVQPCFARSNDMVNLAAGGDALVSDFLDKAKSAKNVCQKQLETLQELGLEMSDTQKVFFDECKASLDLEVQRAAQLSDILARPQNEVAQADEDAIIELADRANAQRAECDAKLAGSQVSGQLLKALEAPQN